VGVFSIIFRKKNEHGDLLFFSLLNSALNFLAIYVNVKNVLVKIFFL